MEKILITGTGRCGTTFLIKLFSFLGFDTGFDRTNYKNFISANCNSGMERLYNEKFYILKNPNFLVNINSILQDKSVKIKSVIIPMREIKKSAVSRVNHKNNAGGLLGAVDEKSQIRFFNHMISNYIYFMTKYDINTIFIDFEKMVNDKSYLFDKIKNILDEKNIEFEQFSNIYDEVTLISKP
jgi:hypothetical protein